MTTMDFFRPTLEATLDARFSDPEYPDELNSNKFNYKSKGAIKN